ncbi:phage major capsid protein, HK97 family [Streptomyces sp. 1331.2]|nr:phage major capsid protein, HK97 family [Streptomyces sp. 1331.2]
MLADLREKLATEKAEASRILSTAQKHNRSLSPNESRLIEQHTERANEISTRIEELTDQALRDAQAAPTARKFSPSLSVTSEPLTYERNSGQSYFRDLAKAQVEHDPEATARLSRHAQEMDVEMPRREKIRRARAEQELRGVDQGGTFERRVNPNRTDGQGGYFVPPMWLIDEYVDLPRFGRTLANSVRNLTLPSGTDSINVPKVATGTAVGVQTADGALVTSQDLTDTFVSVPVRTLAGQQDIALQLLEQSPAGFDEIVFADLMADYNQKLDQQCWTGTGSNGQLLGVLNVSGINSVTYTDASPTLPELYVPVMQALSQVAKNRKLPATALFMTPSRWYWMASTLDTSGRPLVLPDTSSPFNPAALQVGSDVEGYVGKLGAFPVMTDGNIPSNLGGGSNEERIVAMRTSDTYLWEGAMRTRAMPEVLSGTLQVRLQVYSYAAFMPNRRPESIAVLSGTGLISPAGF